MLYSSYCNQRKKGAFFMKKLKITDRERKGMKGRRIALGICATVLGAAQHRSLPALGWNLFFSCIKLRAAF